MLIFQPDARQSLKKAPKRGGAVSLHPDGHFNAPFFCHFQKRGD